MVSCRKGVYGRVLATEALKRIGSSTRVPELSLGPDATERRVRGDRWSVPPDPACPTGFWLLSEVKPHHTAFCVIRSVRVFLFIREQSEPTLRRQLRGACRYQNRPVFGDGNAIRIPGVLGRLRNHLRRFCCRSRSNSTVSRCREDTNPTRREESETDRKERGHVRERPEAIDLRFRRRTSDDRASVIRSSRVRASSSHTEGEVATA
jgi:hypothetical protein